MTATFTPAIRDGLRDRLVAAAREDKRITGVALTGSAALGKEDRWSDIDLAFGIAEAQHEQVIEDWTLRMYRDCEAVHHMDMVVGTTIYRVFLLANTLQVDLAFWRSKEFGALGPSFKLLSGTASHRDLPPSPDASGLIGLAWLYALHARSSIERGRPWQAEYMISGMRDHVIALACLRHGVAAHQGRGVDLLPAEVTSGLTAALVRSLDQPELRRAFGVVVTLLLSEAQHVDPELAGRLSGTLHALAGLDGKRA